MVNAGVVCVGVALVAAAVIVWARHSEWFAVAVGLGVAAAWIAGAEWYRRTQ